MLYLISELGLWLFLTAAFMALAGWAFAAQRAGASERASRRTRENLLRDLSKLAAGDAAGDDDDTRVRSAEAQRSLTDIRDGRIAELERALEQARGRATSAEAEVAALQRRLDSEPATYAEIEPVAAPAPLAAQPEAPDPAAEEQAALQMWRLRYFEQRVRYLETLAREQPEAAAVVTPEAPDPTHALQLDWRAREAEARADHLAQELRGREAAPPVEDAPAAGDADPFAADAEVDALLRWRLLYMERRVAHLQSRPVAVTVEAPPADAPDPDRWRWRARYLESRLRHLEQRPAAAAPQPVSAPVDAVAPEPAQTAALRSTKPPVLPVARNGFPDDFTLIEGVSLQQQSTLYSLGVFHFDQIAAWTDENVAWVDQYLRLRGRIAEEEWVEQAADLARDGIAAIRRQAD